MAYSSSTLYNGLFIVNGNVLMGSNVASSSPIGYPAGSTRLIYSGDDFSNNNAKYYTGTHLQLQAQSVTSQQGKAWGGSVFLEGGKETSSGSNTNGSIKFLTGGFEVMRVASNGYVGINVSTPMYNLDINGTTNIFNQLTVSSIYVRNNIVVSTNITSFNLNTGGSMTSGSNVVATNDVIAFGNITASGVFTGNGSGLTNVAAVTAGSAGTANYAISAGSAPVDHNSPIILYNMAGSSGLNTTGLTFVRTGEATVETGTHFNFFGQADGHYYSYTPPTGIGPSNFVPAISVYSGNSNSYLLFAVAQGSGNVASYGGAYGGVSDSNLKENIDTARDYTDDLCKLRVVKYNFIDDPTYIPLVSTYTSSISLFIPSTSTIVVSTISVTLSTSKHRQIGFIAQEVQKIFPGIVETNYLQDPSTLTYSSSLSLKTSILTPMIITAIQNLKGRLDSHESTITSQADIINLLLSRITNV